MKRLLSVLIVVGLVSVSVLAQSRPSQGTIPGVWRIVEVTTTGQNASTNNKPQPSLFIFTARHYSLIRVNGTMPRPDLPDEAKATAAQLLAVYGNPFTANSGTYEAAGGKLTTRLLVAKFPGAMAAGAFNTYAYKLDGSMLTLTQESTGTGAIANPTTWRLTRVE